MRPGAGGQGAEGEYPRKFRQIAPEVGLFLKKAF
jgi:hypothetical protein